MILLDTHVLVWWLADPAKLTSAAKNAIRTSASKNEVLISAASILEIATLVRRQRLVLSMSFDAWLDDVRALPELQILPITVDIAALAGSFGAEIHGDPIDRLIVATTITAKTKLATADSTIRSSKAIDTVW